MEIKIETIDKFVIVYSNGHIDGKHGQDVTAALLRQASEIPNECNLVLDLQKIHQVNPQSFRLLMPVVRALRARGKTLLVIRAPEESVNVIFENGMDQAIHVQDQVPREQRPAIVLDVNFINPFIVATMETLKTQCSFEVKPGKPYLKGKGPVLPTDIAAIIGMNSYGFSGSVAICFPTPVFLAVMGGMLGEKYTEITAELEDGAGELLNIIFGMAKKVLNEHGHKIERAIPTIVRAQNLKLRHFTPEPALVLPFDSPAGSFHIEAGVSSGMPLK